MSNFVWASDIIPLRRSTNCSLDMNQIDYNSIHHGSWLMNFFFFVKIVCQNKL